MAEEQTKPAPKKMSTATIAIIVVVALVVLGGGGYISRMLSRKAAEKTAENLIKNATGADVDVNGEDVKVTSKDGSVESSKTKTWPTDMPTDVPKFTLGSITETMKMTIGNGQSWTVSFSSIKTGAFETYCDTLKQNGFKEEFNMSTTNEKSAAYSKGKLYASFGTNETDQKATLTVTLSTDTE